MEAQFYYISSDGACLGVFLSLSAEGQARYTAKVTNTALKSDLYTIASECWVAEPKKLPNILWSDMFMFMIVTSSPYTKEELNVSKRV